MILLATVVLTDEQIKALPSTAVQLVAAPGVGKYLVPLFYSMELDRSHGAYSNVTTSDLTQDASKIRIAHGTFGPDACRPLPMEGISGAHGTKRVGYGSGTYNVDDPVVTENQIYIPVFSFPFNGADRLENLPISVCADNTGDFTGGGSGNSMAITLGYFVRTWLSPTN